MLACSTQSSNAITIYQSIGKHGEPTYSQFPPNGQYVILNFYLPKSKQLPTELQKQCQILRDNLAVLSAGGVIQEMDEQGNQKLLNADEVALRTSQTKTALQQHCQ